MSATTLQVMMEHKENLKKTYMLPSGRLFSCPQSAPAEKRVKYFKTTDAIIMLSSQKKRRSLDSFSALHMQSKNPFSSGFVNQVSFFPVTYRYT